MCAGGRSGERGEMKGGRSEGRRDGGERKEAGRGWGC